MRLKASSRAIDLSFERLECRQLLAAGDFLGELDPPELNRESFLSLGISVATDGDLIVAGTSGSSAFVYDAATGELVSELEYTATFPYYFGYNSAVSNGRVAVSAQASGGTVYLFDAYSGELQWTIENPRPYLAANFGKSLAMEGNLLVVGSEGDSLLGSEAGAVHVFDIEQQSLAFTIENPTDLPNFDRFGSSVDIDEGRIAVGAMLDNQPGTPDSGSAFLFDDRGNLLKTFVDPHAVANDRLGNDVAISGRSVLVGASARASNGTEKVGMAVLFDVDSSQVRYRWMPETSTFHAEYGDAVDLFGDRAVVSYQVADESFDVFDVNTGQRIEDTGSQRSVAVSSAALGSDFVVVGITRADVQGAQHSGIVNVHRDDGQVETLENHSRGHDEAFGAAVVMNDHFMLVGAPNTHVAGQAHAGAAFLYSNADRRLIHRFDNPTPREDENFGAQVALSNDYVVISGHNLRNPRKGTEAVYVFDLATGELIKESTGITGPNRRAAAVAISGDRVMVATNQGDGRIFGIDGDFLRYIDFAKQDAAPAYRAKIAVDEGRYLVGLESLNEDTEGLAVLVDAATGSRVETFENPSPDADSAFGVSVGLAGDRAFVGAPSDSRSGFEAGAIYEFRASDGKSVGTIETPHPGQKQFGASIAIARGKMLIGFRRHEAVFVRGRAYIYDLESNRVEHQLRSREAHPSYDDFGYAVALNNRGLAAIGTTFGGVYLYEAFPGPTVTGDVDADGVTTASDVDALEAVIRRGEFDAWYDINQDGQLNEDDRTALIEDVAQTSYGDANFDGVFDSADLVLVFAAGQYEDSSPLDSGWAAGDWNGDGVFDSSDLIVAFQTGRYQLLAP